MHELSPQPAAPQEREPTELALAVSSLEDVERVLARMRIQNQRQIWLAEGLAGLSAAMRGNQSSAELAQTVVTFLCKRLGAPVGAVYIRKNGWLERVGGYAFTPHVDQPNRIPLGQGLLGQAAADFAVRELSELPADYLKLESALGSTTPRSVMMYPFGRQGTADGVIELAFMQPCEAVHRELLHQVGEHIALAFVAAESRETQQNLLRETQRMALDYQTQTEELRLANQQLEMQTRRLKENEEELRLQSEELRQANEELELKTVQQQEQRHNLEERNRQLEAATRELEKRTEQLTVASRYKSDFLANMSHELRTPLNSLLLLAQQLSQNSAGNLNEKQLQSSRAIYDAGKDLLALINDVLDLARIESGVVSVDVGPVALSELVERLSRTFTPLAEQRGIGLHFALAPDAPAKLITDAQKLQQIMTNLLGNALKFTPEGAVSLSVSNVPAGAVPAPLAKLDQPVVALAVTDSGIGVPEDKRGVIFEAFEQLDAGTTRRYGGTGLGLSISRQLACLLGGVITVDSAPTRGSVFTVYLPVDGTPTRAQLVEPPKRTDTVGARSPTSIASAWKLDDDREQLQTGDRSILIIEDDQAFAKILLEHARSLGFKALVASDGKSGLALARAHRPDAITLDLRLPDLDGAVVLERLKSDADTRHIPVQVISIEATPDRSLPRWGRGAFAVLAKPVKLEELETAFKRVREFVERPVRQLLVVSDDAGQQAAIAELLGQPDVQLLRARSGADAQGVLATTRVDCIVLDMVMPDTNALDFLRTLRTHPETSRIPSIVYTSAVLTAHDEFELRRLASSIILKDAAAAERLLDETTLFLHRVEAQLPESRRAVLRNLRENGKTLAGKRALIVDDDVRNVFALTVLLEEQGMTVEYADNGAEALARLESSPMFEIVLMDIMMPEMDGYETMRQIREHKRFQKLPIIALTAKAMSGDRRRCLDAGASDYITKPVDTEQLLSLMRVWLYR